MLFRASAQREEDTLRPTASPSSKIRTPFLCYRIQYSLRYMEQELEDNSCRHYRRSLIVNRIVHCFPGLLLASVLVDTVSSTPASTLSSKPIKHLEMIIGAVLDTHLPYITVIILILWRPRLPNCFRSYTTHTP